MSEFRIASRYAKSLIDLANEKGILEDVYNDMLLVKKVCVDNRDFALMLKNPIIKHDKKRNILNAVFKGKVNDVTIAILDILTRKNRESVIPSIASEFVNQYNVFKGIEVAQITTTIPLDNTLRAEFEKIVSQISDKKSVQLEEKVDKDLIGGYLLRVGDRQLDDSILSKINELKLKFSQNPYIKEF